MALLSSKLKIFRCPWSFAISEADFDGDAEDDGYDSEIRDEDDMVVEGELKGIPIPVDVLKGSSVDDEP